MPLFYAKFGEKQSQDNQRAAALYRLGLAYLGKGERREAWFYFEKTLRYDPYHLWARWFREHEKMKPQINTD
ncbi:MAG: tetratricopeptide repeat protein [bacterium]